MGKTSNKQKKTKPSEQAETRPQATVQATTEPSWFKTYLPDWLRLPLCLAIVLTLGFYMYFDGRAVPKHTFWDENYHLTSAQRYLDRTAQLEPHPPLGLLLIAAGEKLSGTNQDIDKTALLRVKYINADNMPANFSFVGMRLMPSLFGALGAVLFFMLVLEITESEWAALCFSSLYLFENAWIVHFRAVHLESFQMFFCLAAIWLFIRQWKRNTPIPWQQYAWLGCLCSAATLVKVNGVALLMLFPIMYFRDQGTWQCQSWGAQARHFLFKTGVSILGVLVVAYAVFTVHALVGNHPGNPRYESTRKDMPFMSQSYLDYLHGRHALTPITVTVIMWDYFRYMDNDHLGVPKLDICKPGENGSPALHWPVMNKTINYRWDKSGNKTRYVQLVGNEVSWYLGLVAVLVSLLSVANRRLFAIKVGDDETYKLIEVFTGLYVVFMLLNLYLCAQRVMYLYHYFIGLFYSFILIVLNWRYFCRLHDLKIQTSHAIAAGVAVCVIASGIFFLPLSDHKPLTKAQCERRNILSTVVHCQS